jgi:hypothetical protein
MITTGPNEVGDGGNSGPLLVHRHARVVQMHLEGNVPGERGSHHAVHARPSRQIDEGAAEAVDGETSFNTGSPERSFLPKNA